MVCSIPNPPMDRKDVLRFRKNLEKHLRNDFTMAEKKRQEEGKEKSKINAKG